MSYRASLVRFALGAMALAVGACGGEAALRDTSPEGRTNVEIFSWWTGGGEKAALEALVTNLEARYPKLDVINSVQPSDETARARLRERLSRSDPPHSFQVLNGRRVKEWLKTTPKQLEPLDELYVRNDWAKVFFPQVVQLATDTDGHVYCVPINLQRENNLYYDVRLFAELGLQPPNTLAEFHAVSSRLRAAGVIPLALGADKDSAWVVRMLFQSVMVAVTGHAYYQEFFSGLHDPHDLVFREALREFLAVLDETDRASSEYSDWKLAVHQLAERKAAMVIHGDWVVGELTGLQKVPGVDFGEITAPGTAGVFMGSSDCFPLPSGLSPAHKADALALLETIGSQAGQDAFNPLKGSIPARADVDPLRYDALALQRVAAARLDTFVGALPVLTSEFEGNGIQRVIAALRTDYFAAKRLGAPDAVSASIEGAVEALSAQFHGFGWR